MKFYREKKTDYWCKIVNKKITSVYQVIFHNDSICVHFLKNGEQHNSKNAAIIRYDGTRQFILNNIFYNPDIPFTKESWRRFVKMQAFL
jgi:hypothetical protein